MKRGKWHDLDKWNVVLVLFGGALLALWLALPSKLFLRAISMTIEGNTVRYVRQVPYWPVTARWFTEITLADGFTCAPNDWQVSHYEQTPGDTVTFPVWDWAKPCLERRMPYHMTTTRVVLIAGVIPLRAYRVEEGPFDPEKELGSPRSLVQMPLPVEGLDDGR